MPRTSKACGAMQARRRRRAVGARQQRPGVGVQALAGAAADASKASRVDHRADVGAPAAPGRRRRSSRAAPGDHLDHAVGDRLVHAQQAQRRAALAGRAERALHHRVGHLLGQRGRIDQHGVDAAGLGDQRDDGAVLGGERALDGLGHLGRAGEHHAGDARLRPPAPRRRSRPGRAAAAARRAGTPAACSSRTASQRDRRRLLGRLGQHGVAGGERRGHLAGEDRQREVPGADADPGAARRQAQHVALAGGAGQRHAAACMRSASLA